MRRPKYTLDEVRVYLREWKNFNELAAALGVSQRTAITYVWALRPHLEHKVIGIPGRSGRSTSYYRVK